MKQLFFLLFLLFTCHFTYAQKNFYGVGFSYSFTQDFREDIISLKGLSLNYEHKFSPKWSYIIALIGQQSKAIDGTRSTFLNNQPFDTKTTHRLLGIEPLIMYHPNGMGQGLCYGIGLNVKSYGSVVKTNTPNIPRADLFEVVGTERNIVLTVGYNESFENGFRFNPFLNFAVNPSQYNEFPIELRLGCNAMFGGNFFKNLKKK